MTNEPARIPTGDTFRELGPINWVICKIGARQIRAPRFHLFTAVARHSLLLWTWLPFSGVLLIWGALPRRDKEVVILRVGHLRESEYELQQHTRLARSLGVDAATQQRIFEGPHAEGLTERQRALIAATDEFVLDRKVSDATWATLAGHLNDKQLVEFCFLAGQYDTVAAAASTLKLPLDFPESPH